MRPHLVLSSAAAILITTSGLLLDTGPAGAAAPTCDGLPATLVGSPSQTLIRGTAGDDVIVTNGSPATVAGAGDDHVCVTGTGGGDASVQAGAGADVVTVLDGRLTTVLVGLGSGDDVFRGGPEADWVQGLDDTGDDQGADTGRDTISTGAGNDEVTLGGPNEPVHDLVDLGSGDDTLALSATPASDSSFAGGTGRDLLEGREGVAQDGWSFDNVTGRASQNTDGQDGHDSFGWTGFERFYLEFFGDASFLGGPGDEEVWLNGWPAGTDLGGGDDILHLHGSIPAATTPVLGGPGEDLLTATAYGHDRVVGSLRTQRIDGSGGGAGVTLPFGGFEGLDVSADHRLRLVGTPQDDLLRGSACRVRIRGGRGADDLSAWHDSDAIDCMTRATIFGGRGRDRLRGADSPGHGGNDRLIGGRGRDRANGFQGRDRCQAEVRISCERR